MQKENPTDFGGVKIEKDNYCDFILILWFYGIEINKNAPYKIFKVHMWGNKYLFYLFIADLQG